jgi:hypothetical protein
MATASATFGLAVQATWERSQHDQAATRVGTDLALALSTPATDREAAAIATATQGLTTSAVVDRSLALGQYVGSGAADSAPVLIAADSRRAGSLLRGRLDDGRTWSAVGDLLAPGPGVVGLPLSSRGLTIKGSAPRGVVVDVTPTLLVQDASGFRRSVTVDTVRLDGRTHVIDGVGNVKDAHLVAAKLALSGGADSGTATVSVALSVRGTGAASSTDADTDRDWAVQALGAPDTPISGPAVEVRSSAGATTIRTTAEVDLGYLGFADGELLATGFTRPSTP